jgi:hypothetical protein
MNNVAGKSSSLVRGFRFCVYDVMHKRTLTNSLQPRGHTRGEAVSLRLTVTESGLFRSDCGNAEWRKRIGSLDKTRTPDLYRVKVIDPMYSKSGQSGRMTHFDMNGVPAWVWPRHHESCLDYCTVSDTLAV